MEIKKPTCTTQADFFKQIKTKKNLRNNMRFRSQV